MMADAEQEAVIAREDRTTSPEAGVDDGGGDDAGDVMSAQAAIGDSSGYGESKTSMEADADGGANTAHHATSSEVTADGVEGVAGNPTVSSNAAATEWTIASVYNGSTGAFPVSKWVEKHRLEEGKLKDLCLSDDSEGEIYLSARWTVRVSSG